MQIAINANLNQLTGSKSEQLQQVSTQLEALFWQQTLKSMREATNALTGDQNPNSKMYFDMYDTQLSQVLTAQNSLGFNKLIAKQTLKVRQSDPNQQLFSAQSLLQNSVFVKNYPNFSHQDYQQKFVESLIPHVVKSAKKLGVNPIFLVAQAALETNWGKQITGNNLFGIKSHNWAGKSQLNLTFESQNGNWHKEQASFRSYANWQQSCEDYVSFLQNNPRYKKALQVAKNSEQFADELQKAGYATDPNYAFKIRQITKQITSQINPNLLTQLKF